MVNYHLHNIGLEEESTCRFCGEVDETTEHVVCHCDALIRDRYQLLGDSYLEPGRVKQLRLNRVLSFIERIGL